MTKHAEILIKPGFYTDSFIKKLINDGGKGAIEIKSVDVEQGLYLIIKKGYQINIHMDILKFLGIDITFSKNSWLSEGNCYGIPKFYNLKALKLHCDEIESDNNYVQGKKSQML